MICTAHPTFFFIYYACPITISNSTWFVGLYSYLFSKITYLVYTKVNVSFACYFILYKFSSSMLSTNLLKILMYLLIRVSLLTGQFSVRNISAFILSLSCFTRSHSDNKWSVVCSPILQVHIELYIILYLYRYEYVLILPWPIIIIVKFGVTLIFSFNLSATLGKYKFVVKTFVVQSNSICHFVSLFSLSSIFTALFGILSQHTSISLFVAASFANSSASSFPWCPAVLWSNWLCGW